MVRVRRKRERGRAAEFVKIIISFFFSFGKFTFLIAFIFIEKAGHVLVSINGILVNGSILEDGRDVRTVLENSDNYPLNLKFGRPKMTTNEKIFLASMFYPLFAIASQLSPEVKSSGIETLEADTFTLHCLQTLTGIKFIVITEPGLSSVDLLLKKIYELYADYALKNPFYALEMPIRCELFDKKLQALLDMVEKTGLSNLDKT